MRGDIGRHTHRNARTAINQQIRHFGRQNQGFFLATVVIWPKIDGFFVQIGQKVMGDLAQADLGIAHCSSVIPVHGAKVTLAVNQHIAQREVLRHTNDGVIHRRITVRMVFTDYIANYTGRFFVSSVPIVV